MPVSPKRLEFASLPSTLIAYPKALFGKKPLHAPVELVMPGLHMHARRVITSAGHVARYRRVCVIPDSRYLPPAYPHVLAMPLHMQIFTAPSFPVKVLGLVHLRNVIRQLKPIPVGEALSLTALAETKRETESGQEFDIVTRAEAGNELLWEEVSTMLARRHTPGKRPVIDRMPADTDTAHRKNNVQVASETGRRYAWVSGDINPIHLMDFTARRFQFKQTVAHGMWSLARTLGDAADLLPAERMQIDTQFKLPLYLPGDVMVTTWKRTDGSGPWLDLWLSDGKKGRPHLGMQVRELR